MNKIFAIRYVVTIAAKRWTNQIDVDTVSVFWNRNGKYKKCFEDKQSYRIR